MAQNLPIGNNGYRCEIGRYSIDCDDIVQTGEQSQMSHYHSTSFGPSTKRPADAKIDASYQPVLKKEKVQYISDRSDQMPSVEQSQPESASPKMSEDCISRSPTTPQSVIQKSGASVSSFSADSDVIQDIAGLSNYPKPSASRSDSQIDVKSNSSSDALSITKRAPYLCDICKNVFQTKQKLKIHMDSHDSSKRYHCTAPNCGRSFTSQKYLNNHKADHFSRGLECTLCDFVGKNKIDIKNHFKQCHLNDIGQDAFTADWNDMKDILERNIQEIIGGQHVRSPVNCNLFESLATTGNGEQFSPDGTNSTMSIPPFRESGGLSGNTTGNIISSPPSLSTGANSASPGINSSSSGLLQNQPPSDLCEPQFPPAIEPQQDYNSARRFEQPQPTVLSANGVTSYSSTALPYPPNKVRSIYSDKWENQTYFESDCLPSWNLPKGMYKPQNGTASSLWTRQTPQENQPRQYHAAPSTVQTLLPPQQSSQNSHNSMASYKCSNTNNSLRQQPANPIPSYQEEASYTYSQQPQMVSGIGYEQVLPNSSQHHRTYYQDYYSQEYYSHQQSQQAYYQPAPDKQRMNTYVQQAEAPASYHSMVPQQRAPQQQSYNTCSQQQQQQQLIDQHYTNNNSKSNNWSSNTEYYNHQQQSSTSVTSGATSGGPQFNPPEY